MAYSAVKFLAPTWLENCSDLPGARGKIRRCSKGSGDKEFGHLHFSADANEQERPYFEVAHSNVSPDPHKLGPGKVGHGLMLSEQVIVSLRAKPELASRTNVG
jgi:hypothetical protein